MMVYKPGTCAFKVMTRVVANAGADLPDSVRRDINLVVAVNVKQTLKELKDKMGKLDEIIKKFSSMLVKADAPRPSSQSDASVSLKDKLFFRTTASIKTTAADDSSSPTTLKSILENNLGVNALAAEQRQLIKQLRDLIPSIKDKKRRENIAKEVEAMSKELDKKLAKFSAIVDKLSKEELVPRTLKAMATRLINMLSDKSVPFKVSRYLVPAAIDSNTIRFATYIRINEVPSVTDPNKKRSFVAVLFTDVNKNDMRPGSIYLQIAPDYVDPRDLGKPGSGAVLLKSSATKTALVKIHNYLLKNGYILLRPLKSNEPPLDMKALPKWLRDDVSFKSRVITVIYRVGSHPRLGDRHPGGITGKVKPVVVFDGENYLYEGQDARLVKKAGGWYFTPTKELIESIYKTLSNALRSRIYSIYYNPKVAATNSKAGKMNPRDFTATIPLYYTVIQKK